MKKFYFTFILLLSLQKIVAAQVTGVKYQLEYDVEKSNVAVMLVITEGSATSAPHRAQYNSQISIVVPTKAKFTLIENHMPLMGNNSYTGTNPLKWVISSLLYSPAVTPQYDYYSITPTLSPTSFYNNLAVGDRVKLFTVNIKSDSLFLPRLFDNEKDPKSNQAGMGGADFTQGIAIGGIANDYRGNLPTLVLTKTKNKVKNSHISIYPNPTSDYFEIKENVESIKIYGLNGQEIKCDQFQNQNGSKVDISVLSSGTYIVKAIKEGVVFTQKLIKMKNSEL